MCTDLFYIEEFMAVWTGALILVITSRSKTTRFFFENKFILFIGTVSYSFYLIHYTVIAYLNSLDLPLTEVFFLGLLITSVLSYVTYKFIEEPFIKLGKMISTPRKN